MYQIKFGTDGWREIIADQFTVENVRRVAAATAFWLKNNESNPSVVVGFDCRFGGLMFAKETALVLASEGIKVWFSETFVSTPMISLAAFKQQASAGIIITASHNPPTYNGYKVKAGYGGPATPAQIEAIEKLIPENYTPSVNFEEAIKNGLISPLNMEELYLKHAEASFDMPLLKQHAKGLAYDAMYGAGQNVVRKLFSNATLMHAEYNPGFNHRAPEPILKNLPELAELLKQGGHQCGLATDGDADRIGFFDEKGRFVDSHHLILLLIKYLTEFKGLTGDVVKSFSVSDKVEVLCKKKGLNAITTKIGFKYICELMVTSDVLIGAEESGGIAIKGHIPERDGVWMGLVIMEYMAKTGKAVSELIQEVYDEVGTFAVERYDLHITNELKNNIVERCKNKVYTQFGDFKVESIEDIDGFKFRLNEGWVMIRPSGTEPVLRVYAEAVNSEKAFQILDHTKAAILVS